MSMTSRSSAPTREECVERARQLSPRFAERAERSSIRTDQLPLLDAYLVEQRKLQEKLRQKLVHEGKLPPGFGAGKSFK